MARLERAQSLAGAGRVATGHTAIDAALGGGIARGRLHELFAQDRADAGSVCGFAAMLAARLGGPLVWVRTVSAQAEGGRLHAPGFGEIGIDPARLILCTPHDPLGVLRTAADAARCPAVGTVVVELWRAPRVLDLTATRRLALASEASGVTVLLLQVQAEPAPSAVQTRWLVSAAASAPLEANAPGPPTLTLALLRNRGRPETGRWHVEWDRDRTVLHEHRLAAPARPASGGASRAAPPGPLVSLPARGAGAAEPDLARLRTG